MGSPSKKWYLRRDSICCEHGPVHCSGRPAAKKSRTAFNAVSVIPTTLNGRERTNKKGGPLQLANSQSASFSNRPNWWGGPMVRSATVPVSWLRGTKPNPRACMSPCSIQELTKQLDRQIADHLGQAMEKL